MFSALNISGSGMSANSEWLEVTSNNIANMNTTRTQNGGPYHRQTITFQSKSKFDDLLQQQIGSGVEVSQVKQDPTEDIVHDPSSPDADANGNVRMPAIDLSAEMTNLIMAQRGYEANVTTFNATKTEMQTELEIGKV